MNSNDPDELRESNKCHVTKPLKDFVYTLQYGYVQYKRYCRECNNKRNREYRLRRKNEVKDSTTNV